MMNFRRREIHDSREMPFCLMKRKPATAREKSGKKSMIHK